MKDEELRHMQTMGELHKISNSLSAISVWLFVLVVEGLLIFFAMGGD